MTEKEKLELAQVLIDSYRKVYYKDWIEFRGRLYNYYYNQGRFINIVDEAVFVRINKTTVMKIDLMHYYPGFIPMTFYNNPKEMLKEGHIEFFPWNRYEVGRELEAPKEIQR